MFTARSIAIWLAIGSSVAVWSAQKKPEGNADGRSLQAAKATFESVCAACHGLDGRGGERGPDIASRPDVVHKTDVSLLATIRQGKPAAGMPAFASYGDKQLSALVVYLRTLQGAGKQNSAVGDPAAGKALFFGKAKCSECHMVAGQGGFLAPDLTRYAATKTADQVHTAIVAPNKDRDPRRGLVTVTLADSAVLTGVPRNEDNFSLQLQTPDGRFHLLSKANIVALVREAKSAMPSDYARTLSATERNDLIGYLLRTAGSDGARKSATNLEDGDDE